jgi:hypothetical protein
VDSINEDFALQLRAQEKVVQLNAYEALHPRQGPDAQGRPYDPVADVIWPWLEDDPTKARAEIDEVRTATIKSRTWEGFAWANHRFVLSDERGNALIVGFNEDAKKWFMDTTTPVVLPPDWVANFMAEFERDGRLEGLYDPRDIHAKIVETVGYIVPTIPSVDEIAAHLSSRHAY